MYLENNNYLEGSSQSQPKNLKKKGTIYRERESTIPGILCKDLSNKDNTVANGELSEAGLTNKLKRSTRSEKSLKKKKKKTRLANEFVKQIVNHMK